MTKHSSPSESEPLEDFAQKVREQLKAFEKEFIDAQKFIKKHPVASVLGAVFVGYFLGQLFKGKKVVYVEGPKK